MKKRTRIFDVALRMLLSFALVVSFVPIVPSSSFADEAGDNVNETSDADTLASTSSFDNAAGENNPNASLSFSTSGKTAEGGASSEGGDGTEGESGTALEPASCESLDAGDSSASDSAAASSDQANKSPDNSPSNDYVRQYGKLMADGNIYECDESGVLKWSTEEAETIEPYNVANLIVDSKVTTIRYHQFASCHNLKSVRFEGKTLDSIDDTAFHDCRNLTSVDFSGMTIGYLGELAFGTCVSLTGLTLNEPVTIQAMGYGCFSYTGLTTTSLDKIKGLTSLPGGVFSQCYDLVETGLDKNTTIHSIGSEAFAYCYGLTDTGLGSNTSVTTISEYAFVGCDHLTDTGLGTNELITTIGDYAFKDCKNLRLSGLETNTTVSSIGKSCFENSDMSGGLVLPKGSKITQIPQGAFYKTKLDFVYFQCDHAVLVDSQTFPNGFIKVLVPARSLDLYQNNEVKRDWEACNYDLPYDASNYLSISIASDPNRLVYQKGDAVSLSGMQVKFNYDGTQHTFDYADLASNYAFSQFFSFSPDNGSTFRVSDNGAPVRVAYNDGDHLLSAYSSGLLKEEGSTAFSVYVESPTAQLGETATGGGQFALGDTCTVSAATTIDGRLFAYWADEKGNFLSEKKTYEFSVERSIVLTAVFADEIVVSPKARLNLANGSEVENVTFSIVADNCNYGETFVTYPDKMVTITCNYDSSKWSIDHWVYSDGAYWIAGSENSATVSYTVEGKGDPVAILREKEQPDPDPGKPIDPVVAVHVDYSQTIDLGGRALMEGVEVPNVSGSRFLFAGQFVALDAERLGMLDDDIELVGWYDKETGACLSERRVCLFKPEINMSIEARFALKDVAVHINSPKSTDSSEDYAHVTPTTGNCYRNAGEVVELSATADNAQFRGWYEGESGNESLISDSLSCDYAVCDNNQSQVEITPWYCAQQASVVLDVDGTTEDGSPQGSFITTGLYGIGSSVTVVAIPAPYYVLDYVTDAAGNRVNVSENGSYTFTLEGDTQLTAHFRETSDGDEAFIALQAALIAALGVAIVASTAGGFGEFVDPIAVPAIIEVGEAETIEELVEVGGKALKEIEEIFEKHKHDRDPDKPKGDHTAEIIATAQPEAGGIVKGGGVHFEGTIAEFDAIANPGYHFVCWKEDGIERSTLPHMQMAITDATPDVVKLTAEFEKDVTITTSVDVEGTAADDVTGCSTAPDRQIVRHGEQATVVATPGEGYEFVGWFEGALEVSNTPTYSFVAETDRHLVAKFNRMCTVTAKVEPASALAGKCTIVGEGKCVVGKPVVLSASLDESMRDSYTFKGWYRGDTDVLMGTDEAHLEFVPDGDTVVRAVYVAKKYEVGVKIDGLLPGINPHGEVEIMGYPGMGSVELPYGRHVTIKATPNDKYWFAYWEDTSGKHYPDSELRVCVTKDETYTAVFKKGPDVIITADAYWGGKVTCNGEEVKPDADKYALDETLHLAAEPNPGFLFWGWYRNGLLVSTDRECTLSAEESPISGKCTIVAAFKPLDVVCLPVASPAEGGTVTASRLFADRGSDVRLKATAAPGYVFEGWYVGDELVSGDAEFTCKEGRSHVHVARFKQQDFTVEASAVVADETGTLFEDAAAGRVEGAGAIGAGRSARLVAYANEGYVFKRWVDDTGATVSTDVEYRFVPWANTKIRAVFEAKRFTVAVNAAEGFGTVEGAGTYAAGQQATVTVIPSEGASFVGWYSEGSCVSTDTVYSFTVLDDAALTAVFGSDPYVVSAIASPADAGYTSGFGTFNNGDRTTLSAVAKPGYTFDCWKDSQGNTVSELPECTVDVSDSSAYVAFFTPDSYLVSLHANPDASGALQGAGTYKFGDTVELNAQPTSGKRFVGWYLVESEDDEAAAGGDSGTGSNGAGGNGFSGNEPATLFSKDAHCWFTIDEDLIRDISNSELSLEARFADPYEVSVSAKAVVSGKVGSRGCRVIGTGTYSSGDSVTLQAVAGEGYRFMGWSLDEAGNVIESNDAIFEFEAGADVSYYAQFVPEDPVVIAVTQSSMFRGLAFMVGTFGAATSVQVDKGDPFVAMAIPYPGMHFSHWVNDAGAIVSYNAIHVGVARENMRLTAIFYETGFDAQVATYPAGAGFSMVVPGTGTSYKSASVMVTIPYPGWKFKYWADEVGVPVGFSPVMARPAYANRTFTAYYVKEQVEVVAIDPREGGYVEGSDAYSEGGYALVRSVDSGNTVTLSAVPYDGYEFVGWYDYADRDAENAQPLSTDVHWTFYPEADMKVVPRFKEVQKYSVEAAAEHGTVNPESADVIPGGSLTFTTSPDQNCYLDHVSTTLVTMSEGAGVGSSQGNFDISDYEGGAYQFELRNVTSSQALTFAFAEAGAPVIDAQPQDTSVREGESATLSVAADASQGVRDHEAASSGAAANHELTYQWYRVGEDGQSTPVEGAHLATLEVKASDAGEYYCRVTQSYLGTETTTDSNHATVSRVEPEALVFNTTALPTATAHTEYKTSINPATGGTSPYTYSLAQGSTLPVGVTFTASEKGLSLSGTPDSTGVFAFDIDCVDHSGQSATAHFTLAIMPKIVDLAFLGSLFIYNGQPQGPSLSGVPENLYDAITYTYTGIGETHYSSSQPPTNAGSYRATATLNSGGYRGAATIKYTILKKPVHLELTAEDATYDGSSHGATVSAQDVAPEDYEITYRGANGTEYGPTSKAPIDAGSYVAEAKLVNPNMVGSQTATYTISPAEQVIEGKTDYTATYGNAGIVFENTAKTPVSYEVIPNEDDSPSPISIQGSYASIVSAGKVRVVAHAAASRNYSAAKDVELTVNVSPAPLLVIVDDAERFEGEENPAFTSSLISPASTEGVAVSYSCLADATSPAGEYEIGANTSNSNFAVTVEPGTLTVKVKDPVDPVDPDNPDGPNNPGKPDNTDDSTNPSDSNFSGESGGPGASNGGQNASSDLLKNEKSCNTLGKSSGQESLGELSENGDLSLSDSSEKDETKNAQERSSLLADKKSQLLIAVLLALGCGALIAFLVVIRRRRS